jgi:hypothetical protein
MITQLAPLGATHSIVLILAYGEPPKLVDPNPNETQIESEGRLQDVTITAHIKPKDGVKGEPRHLQFKGSIADVSREIGEKLPAAVNKIVEHTASLEQLDKDLAAEKEKAKAENTKKIEAAKKEAVKPALKKFTSKAKPTPAKKPAPAQKKSAARSKAAAKAADTRDKQRTAAKKPADKPADTSAEDALAQLAAAANPEGSSQETPSAEAAQASLENLAAAGTATTDEVEL